MILSIALKEFYTKRIRKEFSDHQTKFLKSLTKQGCHLTGEALGFNLYPFYFEEWVMDLVNKTSRVNVGEITGD